MKEAGKNNARKCNNKPERLFAVKADVEEELAPQLHADHGDLFHLWCLLETRPRGKSLSVWTCTCVRECIHAGAPEQLCKLCIFSYCECPPWLFWPSFRGLRFQMQASVGFSVNVCTQEVLFTNCLVSLNSSLSAELEVLWTGLVLLVHEQDVLPCSILTKGTQSLK